VGGSCALDNEPLSSVKGGEFRDKLNKYWLLKKDPTPWS
jgi:hypothetical protein